MSALDKKNDGPTSTAVAPLLYWLAVVLGVAGITLLRLDEPRFYVPLWFGSVVGVAIGQGLALLRVRAWVPLVAMGGLAWFGGAIVFIVLDAMFGSVADTVALAIVPAAVCGYASLSERGALLSFWYPVMLWMIVILDGPADGLTGDRSLPFLLGIGALFIAFMVARETRRVALWRAHGAARLATPLERNVLRTAPLRTLAQHAWTAMVGCGALALTAWIAPHLWAKEEAKHHASLAMPEIPSTQEGTGYRCCPVHEQPRERIREYISLQKESEGEHHDTFSCVVCEENVPTQVGPYAWTYDGTPGSWLGSKIGADGPWGDGSGSSTDDSGSYAYSSPTETTSSSPAAFTYDLPQAASPTPTPVPPVPVVATPPVAPKAPPQPPAGTGPKPAALPTPIAGAPSTASGATPSAEAVPARSPGVPWDGMLAACIGGLLLHLVFRAARRTLTLRHLASPIWSEPLDQRVSNHWQRMLVGLRDAGIRLARNEQPLAFARRVGIDGMKECAAVLERVRHGVRVDSADLSTIASAATTVYRTSRKRAGLIARVTGTFRWPLV